MISVIKLLIALLGSSILVYTYSFLIKQLGIYPKFSIKKIIYKKKFQRLKEAALKTDLQALKELQASGFNINEDNYIVLEWACRKGNLPIVKLCVELGINIKAKENALIYACMDGHFPIIEYLIDSGASPRAFHDAILRYSANQGYFEISKYLISKGCDPHSILNPHPESGILMSIKDRAKEWARQYINAQEMAKKLDKELQPKTTTKTGRIKI